MGRIRSLPISAGAAAVRVRAAGGAAHPPAGGHLRAHHGRALSAHPRRDRAATGCPPAAPSVVDAGEQGGSPAPCRAAPRSPATGPAPPGGVGLMRVVVVGAGLAGLAAVCRLADLGCEVVLVERSRLLGGKATSFSVDGVEVDNGQHVHLGCCTEYLDFVDRLGMSDVRWTQPRFEVTVLRRVARPPHLRAARGLPASLSLLPSFTWYAHLPMSAKLQVARALRRCGDPSRPGETFAAWLSRHGQGAAAVHGFWEVFVVPALNARIDEVRAEGAL